MIKAILDRVSGERMRRDLFHLCRDPLPFRKANYTRPGQSVSSLAEADAFIRGQFAAAGYTVSATTHRVQAYRCDSAKPLHHWYSTPDPADPAYEVANLLTQRVGGARPEEIIQLVSHKDSMSWIDSPGAHDNATGAVLNLELARVLATCELKRTVHWLFCNEEHTPWTSKAAAQAAAGRGDRIIAVLNQDSLDGKPEAEAAAGKLTHAVTYSTDEGRALAELIAGCARRYGLGLEVKVALKEHINDDDGSFINAGFRRTVMNIGSWPYGDREYHLPGDVPERVNIENLVASARLVLAAVLELDGEV